MSLDLSYALQGLPTPKKKPKVVRKRQRKVTEFTRKWGQDSDFTCLTICAVFDLTDGILYIIGGVGTTEKFVTRLVNRKKPHELHLFKKSKRDPELPYKVVSWSRATGYGSRLNDMATKAEFQWKKIVVMPGTAEFIVMVKSERGRRSRVTQ